MTSKEAYVSFMACLSTYIAKNKKQAAIAAVENEKMVSETVEIERTTTATIEIVKMAIMTIEKNMKDVDAIKEEKNMMDIHVIKKEKGVMDTDTIKVVEEIEGCFSTKR